MRPTQREKWRPHTYLRHPLQRIRVRVLSIRWKNLALHLLRGCFPGDPARLRRGLQLVDPSLFGTPAFSVSLRPICDVIFDSLLVAYTSGLVALQAKVRKPKEVLTEYDTALTLADEALKKFRAADIKRQEGLVVVANATAEEALDILEQRWVLCTLMLCN